MDVGIFKENEKKTSSTFKRIYGKYEGLFKSKITQFTKLLKKKIKLRNNLY